jgi:hypothetical protein
MSDWSVCILPAASTALGATHHLNRGRSADGDAANVQELHDDAAILRMDGMDHLAPGAHLFGVVDGGG